LLEWLRQSGIAGAAEIEAIRQTWSVRRGSATKAYKTAIRLRESIYRLFVACIAQSEPPRWEAEFLGQFLWQWPTTLRLRWDGKRLCWHPDGKKPDVLDLFRPIALSGAELLTGNRAQDPTVSGQARVRMALCRCKPTAEPTLVLDGRLRQSRQGAPSSGASPH